MFNVVVLLLNLVSTLFMVGLIWFVQIVHYPLFKFARGDEFVVYQRQHQRLTTWVVAVPMIVEAVTSGLLVLYPPPTNSALVLLGVGLLFIIWVSTALLQVPCHEELTRGFDARIHNQLVWTNWVRTICWTLRGFLVCWFVVATISSA